MFICKIEDQLNGTYKQLVSRLDEQISRINNEFKKLIRPLDTASLKLDELIPLEQRLNKTMGDIELQITMNSITQQRMNTEFEAIKNSRERESEKKNFANEAKLTNIAKQGRIKAVEQQRKVEDTNQQLDKSISDSNQIIDQLNEIIVRPPLGLDQLGTTTDLELIYETSQKLIGETGRIKKDMMKSVENIKEGQQRLENFKPNEDHYKKHIDLAISSHKEIIFRVRKFYKIDNMDSLLKKYSNVS